MKANRINLNVVRSYLFESLKSKTMAKGLLFALILFLPAICMAECELDAPQKIVIDTAHNRLLVSNFDTGDITQIDDSGNEDCLAQGAGFIDGMEIVGYNVYGAADPKSIKVYDLETGFPIQMETISGTGYLSSIVKDNSGHLYISCPPGDEIYKMRVSDLSYWTFVGGSALNKPNGMIFQEEENRLIVVEDRPNPSIKAINLADSTVTTLTTTTLIGADGIAEDMVGNYYVTGYYLPAVYRFDSDFSQPPEIIYEEDGLVYPTYDASDNSLLITDYNDNTWVRISLDPYGIIPTESPKSFFLHPNYPNPFIPGTTIQFDLDTYARARLDVYNVLGNPVKTLVDEPKGPGNYSVKWDGKNDLGKQVAGGTYYFRLKVGGLEQTQKAILIK